MDVDAAEAVAEVEVAVEVEAAGDGINSSNNKILLTSRIQIKILSYRINNNNSYPNIAGHTELVDILLMFAELHSQIIAGKQHSRTE